MDCRPDAGMDNLDWAMSLRAKMGTLSEPDADDFLASALNYATIYSERPADRFAKEHLIPGHKIQTEDDGRPGWISVRCSDCNSEDLSIENREAALVCMVLSLPRGSDAGREESPAA